MGDHSSQLSTNHYRNYLEILGLYTSNHRTTTFSGSLESNLALLGCEVLIFLLIFLYIEVLNERVFHHVMLLPPEILVVKSVVLVQLFQIVRQMSNGWKIESVDERAGRSKFGMMAVCIQNNRNHWIPNGIIEPNTIITQ